METGVKIVKLEGKEFRTPFKAYSGIAPAGAVREIPVAFSKGIIEKSRDGKTALDYLPGKCRKDAINFIVPRYTDLTITGKEIEVMDNRVFPHTDAVIVPRWEGILNKYQKQDIVEALWKQTSKYIEEVRSLDDKLIIGNIPLNISERVADRLLEKYIKEGVTSFVLDFGGRQLPTYAYVVRGIRKKMKESFPDGDYILYSMNMRKSHDYMGYKPADDFLSFAEGFDIMGNYHIPVNGGSSMVKMFSSDDWVYETLEQGTLSYERLKALNETSMNKEAGSVRAEIKENGSAMGIAKTKKGASEYTQGKQSDLDFKGFSWK